MILVTGGSGLVGKYLKNVIPDAIFVSSADYNLMNLHEVERMMEFYSPTKVIHLAGKVGGLLDNINNPVSYLEDNIIMNTNVVKTCYNFNVQKVIAMLSTCIYPDIVDTYPLKEDDMFNGAPPLGNFQYAIAKRCMAAQIEAYNKQHNKNWLCLIPCNLYGEYDKYTEHNSHFVGALIKKIYHSDDKLEIWGTGKPLRQFMYAEDLAKIIKLVIDSNISGNYNVAPDYVHSIEEIARIALKSCNKENLEIIYNDSKPDGQYRKDVDSSKLLSAIGDFKFTPLDVGIKKTYDVVSKKW